MNENGDKSIEYTDDTGEILYGYIYMQMSFKNLTNDFMNNIRNDYVNFCKQIYEGQAILNTFDEMMKYKYNFQSEAKQDMENIRKSLVVMLYNYGITASFVEKYDTSTDNKDITEANHKAIDYIKNHSGLYDEPEGYSYCYVVNRPITLRVSGTGYNMRIKTRYHSGRKLTRWIYDSYEDRGTDPYVYRYDYIDERVYQTPTAGAPIIYRIPAGYYISEDRMDKTNLFSNNILSSKDLKMMKARFNSLKSSNRFASYKDMTFGDYMTSGKLINAMSKYMVHQAKSAVNRSAIKPTKILTSGVLEKEMPLDGTRTLVCSKAGLSFGYKIYEGTPEGYIYGGGYYFTPKKKYSLINPDSSDYDRKASKEYFHIHKEYDATVYDLETDSIKDNYVVLQAALYGESHFYWSCHEGAYFYNTNYREPYFIFPIG